MIHGNWEDCVIDISSDDDLSGEVDLGKPYETLLVLIPTIDSADLTCYVAEVIGGTYYALGNGVTVAAGTGNYADVWEIGGNQHIKIGTSASQSADRTFKIMGVRS